MQKLTTLTDSAKYDVACTSSGVDRAAERGKLGSAVAAGICHSFSADGRCIALLKVLMSNACIYDCQYCVNRRSNDTPRTSFTPRELAELTIGFYRRNYIEGLFLSSGVVRDPDYSMEQMTAAIRIIREEYGFNGYIHAKTIPGASQESIEALGLLVDRLSINIELPSEQSLQLLAPDKHKSGILKPMRSISEGIKESSHALTRYRHAPRFAPAGQSTQMIIGATPDSDFQILRLSESLYKRYSLKRVFFSAYIPVGTSALLPQNVPPPLLREHRLYQADWLLRFYGFTADEIVDESQPSLDPLLDPKCHWALRHLDQFPVDINRADPEMLLRIPGIGVTGTRRIVQARRAGPLNFHHLKTLRIVLRRAAYFITCSGRMMPGVKFDPLFIYHSLTSDAKLLRGLPSGEHEQLSLAGCGLKPLREDVQSCLTGQL